MRLVFRCWSQDGPGLRLEEVARTVAALGHDVIARSTSLAEIGPITATERPDVALVVVTDRDLRALELIDRIVHEAACPQSRVTSPHSLTDPSRSDPPSVASPACRSRGPC